MDKIRQWLYMGSFNDTQDKNQLEMKSIRAMLQLASPVKLPGIESLYVPVNDMSPISAEKLREGVDFVLAEKNKGNSILVACAAGINRSAAFCIASLKEAEGITLLEAFKEVKKNRIQAMPQEVVWESLCEYYREQTPYIEVMRVSISS